MCPLPPLLSLLFVTLSLKDGIIRFTEDEEDHTTGSIPRFFILIKPRSENFYVLKPAFDLKTDFRVNFCVKSFKNFGHQGIFLFRSVSNIDTFTQQFFSTMYLKLCPQSFCPLPLQTLPSSPWSCTWNR